jgi:hypothetical protein
MPEQETIEEEWDFLEILDNPIMIPAPTRRK